VRIRKMSTYDDILKEARTKVQAFRQMTAREYIPRMYWALRDENPHISPEDARDRIDKDCFGMWEKRTILDALPDEAKDLKKQKSGRLSQKKANSAAGTAAQSAKERQDIVIDSEGNSWLSIYSSVSQTPSHIPNCVVDIYTHRYRYILYNGCGRSAAWAAC
jgi:hypothetical protein